MNENIKLVLHSIFLWLMISLAYLYITNTLVSQGQILKEGVNALVYSIIFGGVFAVVFFIFRKWFGL